MASRVPPRVAALQPKTQNSRMQHGGGHCWRQGVQRLDVEAGFQGSVESCQRERSSGLRLTPHGGR